MNNRIIHALLDIKDMYGDMIFYDQQKTKNLLHDLSPGLHRERIHVGQFLELNGYFQLKYAGHSYNIVRARLLQNYISTYAVQESVAIWILDVFSEVLGLSDFKDADKMIHVDVGVDVDVDVDADVDVDDEVIMPAERISLIGRPKPKPQPQLVSHTNQLNTLPPLSQRISADMHTVAVMATGKVRATGPNEYGECNVDKWQDIISVSAGPHFTIGLKNNGEVVATGRNEYGQCNVYNWQDIIQIQAGARHTVGLKSDGTVVATGQNNKGECNVSSWRNIIHISAGYQCTFGIKKDYKVLVQGSIKNIDISNTKDIVNPYPHRVLALKRTGRLSAIGQLKNTVAKWKEVEQISAGPDYFAGLFKDGTVRVLAYYWIPTGIELSTDEWTGIKAIAAGRFHLLGVRNDGTIRAVMMHPSPEMDKGQCRVRNWRL